MPTVTVVDYDPMWPITFGRLRDRIWPGIGEIATSIEHVGSTSVPGLAAKPIIDMTIVVPTVDAMTHVIARLARIGYSHRGDLGITGREAFSAPAESPPHHLYACIAGCDALRNHLGLRDFLSSDPASARAYAALKKELAARFPDDIDAYGAGKTDYIVTALANAGFTNAQLSAIRTINAKQKAG